MMPSTLLERSESMALIARDIVMVDTPSALATSLSVTLDPLLFAFLAIAWFVSSISNTESI